MKIRDIENYLETNMEFGWSLCKCAGFWRLENRYPKTDEDRVDGKTIEGVFKKARQAQRQKKGNWGL